MALYIANKIRSSMLPKPLKRAFTVKPEYAVTASSQVGGGHEERSAATKDGAAVQSKRYSINQPAFRVSHNLCPGETHASIVKKNVDRQNLQPAMLPEYFKPAMDLSSGIYPGDRSPPENQAQSKRFAESKTVLSINSPLKASKLASPFPEPVKVMLSHTVSDQEKADQMLADSRSAVLINRGQQGAASSTDGAGKAKHAVALAQQRSYSTKTGDGKKKKNDLGRKECRLGISEKCPAFKIPECDQAQTKACGRVHPSKPCCKVEAPYPSYSESCAEELEDSVSECKLCPWKPENNPHYGPHIKKRKMHMWTGRRYYSTERAAYGACAPLTTTSPHIEVGPRYIRLTTGSVIGDKKRRDDADDMRLEIRKKPCEKPKIRQCPSNEDGKKTKKVKKGSGGGKKKKAKGRRVGWAAALRAWAQANNPFRLPDLQPAESKRSPETAIEALELKDKNRCKKLNFDDSFVHPKRQPRLQVPCKKKKRRLRVTDCPEKDKCKRSLEAMPLRGDEVSVAPDFLSEVIRAASRKDKGKCPTIQKGKCHPEEESKENHDPCNRKPRPRTLRCPEDVFIKKKRPRPKPKPCTVDKSAAAPEHKPGFGVPSSDKAPPPPFIARIEGVAPNSTSFFGP